MSAIHSRKSAQIGEFAVFGKRQTYAASLRRPVAILAKSLTKSRV